jgi:nickel/cobalt exporter
MTDPALLLLFSAVTLGVLHTAIGVDHTLPFVLLARARGWSLSRTVLITLACGLGHVLSSVLISALGLGLGVAGGQVAAIEETRGSWAAWCLVGLGLSYAGVALWNERKRGRRSSAPRQGHLVTALFLVFTLGPCEALLPLLTASGLSLSFFEGALVTVAFSVATLATMLALVTLGYVGTSVPSLRQRFSHAGAGTHVLAGSIMALCGLSMQFLGI